MESIWSINGMKAGRPGKDLPEYAENVVIGAGMAGILCAFLLREAGCPVTVLEAETIQGSDKLLKLTVDAGDGTRTVVSGIRAAYSAEEMVGKKVVLLKNLRPAKLRGIMSEGMLLCAAHDGKLSLVTIEGDLPAGSEVC